MGPLSLSKEIAKVSKEGVTVGAPKTVLETTKKVAQETAKKVKAPETKNILIPTQTVTSKRPWYVNIMPKYLRTTKDVKVIGPEKLPWSGAPFAMRQVTEGVGWDKMTEGEKLPVQADKGIEIDISELFGGEPEIYEQQELTSGIDFYDTDEQGNVIQAQ